MNQTARELTFEEQSELNQAIISRIQTKLPAYTSELEQLKHSTGDHRQAQNLKVKELQESLDDKLNTLQEQESEKVPISFFVEFLF